MNSSTRFIALSNWYSSKNEVTSARVLESLPRIQRSAVLSDAGLAGAEVSFSKYLETNCPRL